MFFFFWLRTSNISGLYIWKEIKLSYTHILFLNQKATNFSKTIFYLKNLPSIASYYSKYSISYKIFWENKVLQRAYILRAVQARKDNQQRWLGCCILGTTCRNYIGYTVNGTICLKTVTWSTPHLCHLFLVKSNCVISKENSGIISPLFPT